MRFPPPVPFPARPRSVRSFALRARRAGSLVLLLPLLLPFASGCTVSEATGRAVLPPVDRSADPGAGAEGRPAILLSVDALNEAILRATLTPEEAPALFRLFEEGMCTAHAESFFPTVTASSHAVLWTGAGGDVTGVTANTQPVLPRDRHTLLETQNGFNYRALNAEPLWITAGLHGVPVAGHHVTQAPGVPGYQAASGARTPWHEARRSESARALARADVNVMNGYNRIIERQRILRGIDVTWLDGDPTGPPVTWEGVEALGSTLPPLPFTLEMAEGPSLQGLVIAEGEGYDALLLGLERRVAGSLLARAAPVESEPLSTGRALARHFAGPLFVPVEGGAYPLEVRLFEMAPDGRDFELYQPPLHVVEGNREDLVPAYDQAIGGWTGNSGFFVYRTGGFGPRLMDGGDGTAEARYLETAEHLTRQFNAGSTWLWETHRPRLLLDYFPLSDAIDHELMGFLDPAWPGHDLAQAEAVRAFRARVWGLVDLRVAHLTALAESAGGAIFVSGDHGMRGSWNVFLPNLALRDAGLLVLDEAGQIDLSRSRAVAPNGYWISVNRTAWRDGIVPPEEEAEVIAQVRAALEGVRSPDGERVVLRTFTPDTHPGFGIGGPAGGDVYWATAPGYRSLSSTRGGAVTASSTLSGGHGFPPDEPDMYTVFCALGADFPAGRVPSERTTVVAPTVAEWVGLPAPADAVGRSILGALLEGGDPVVRAMEERIAAEGSQVRVGVAFHDLQTARRIELGDGAPFHAASTMKVPVLYELFQRHDNGELDVEALLPVRNTFRSVHDGSPFTLDTDQDTGLLAALGGQRSARSIAHGMITVSSNLGTNLLLEWLEPGRVQATLDRFGAGGMQVRRGVSDLPAFEAGFSNETTAAGLLRVMELVARCEGVGQEACADMHQILEEQTYRSEIPAGLPEGIRVGNKTGSITGILHDAAIIHPEGRSPWILVVLTQGFEQPGQASALITDLARIAYEGVEATAVSDARSTSRAGPAGEGLRE